MAIHIDLPEPIEEKLRKSLGDLAVALGLSRLEADAVLEHHGVTEVLQAADELDEQIRSARDRRTRS